MARYKLLHGSHSQGEKTKDEQGNEITKVYTSKRKNPQGTDIVESAVDLVALHGASKFARIEDAPPPPAPKAPTPTPEPKAEPTPARTQPASSSKTSKR